jgi:hypothetical protein
MSNKKSLLTESEIRRFMTLANIPSVGKLNETSEAERYASGEPGLEMRKTPMKSEGDVGVYEEDPMPEEPSAGEGDELDLGDMDAGGEMGAGGDDKEARFEEAIMTLAELAGIEIDTGSGEAAGGVEMGADSEEEEDESDEEEEEEEEEVEENMEVEEGEPVEGQPEPSAVMQEAKLVDAVLARVTARLVAEAKKKKAGVAAAKKKADMKKKAADMKKKKAGAGEKAPKKLEEANAAAPKSTMSNASKAGVAKAAGKADKGTWGVSSKVQDMEWKEGKGKGGHEMSTESASAEHIVSHGKKNLATQGGNKSK